MRSSSSELEAHLGALLGRPRARGLARRLLEGRTPADLLAATPRALVAAAGGTPTQAQRLETLLQVARQLQPMAQGPPGAIASSREAASLLLPLALGRETEVFWAVHLDARRRPCRVQEVSVGTLTSSLVHPREVFREAIRAGAASLLVAHNHPSGDPEPSHEDSLVTRRLVESGRLLGIPVEDHLILASHSWISLRDRPGWPHSVAPRPG